MIVPKALIKGIGGISSLSSRLYIATVVKGHGSNQ